MGGRGREGGEGGGGDLGGGGECKIEKKDLTAKKVEKVLDTEQDEEVKKEIVDKFQDKLLKDLEKKGLINVSDEEE